MRTLVISLSLLISFVAYAAPKSLCNAAETVAFSCTTGQGKFISICASSSQVHYRFGRSNAIELVYPSSVPYSPSLFKYYHYFRAGAHETSLSFKTPGATYTVFDDSDELGGQESGVSVQTRSAAKSIKITCNKEPIAKWSELEGLVSCSKDDMNSCRPPN